VRQEVEAGDVWPQPRQLHPRRPGLGGSAFEAQRDGELGAVALQGQAGRRLPAVAAGGPDAAAVEVQTDEAHVMIL
jgi:hypothetical protein